MALISVSPVGCELCEYVIPNTNRVFQFSFLEIDLIRDSLILERLM